MGAEPEIINEEPKDDYEETPAIVEPEVPQMPEKEDDNCKVLFSTPDGDKLITFYFRPLGLQYRTWNPLKLTMVRETGYANHLGCQVGWVILEIDGESQKDKKYKYTKPL